MKYKIGDEVRIRKDLEIGKFYEGETTNGYVVDYAGGDIVNAHMSDYAGEFATIERVRENGYEICLDNGMWNWTSEMFETMNVKDGMMVVKDTGAIGIVSWGKRAPYVRFDDGTWSYVGELDADRVCFYEEVGVEI